MRFIVKRVILLAIRLNLKREKTEALKEQRKGH